MTFPFALGLATLPALAQGTSEQRAACTGDAMRLCISAVPDIGRVTACMRSHYGELSPRCQASFSDAGQGAPPRKLADAPAKPVQPKLVQPKLVQTKSVQTKSVQPAAVKAAEAKRPAPHPAVLQTRRDVVQRPVAVPRERVARTALVAPQAEHADAVRRRAVRSVMMRRPRAVEEAPRPYAAREVPSREFVPQSPEVAVAADRYPPYPDVAVDVPQRARLVTGVSAGRLAAAACRDGLIDSFTCGQTIPLLGLGE